MNRKAAQRKPPPSPASISGQRLAVKRKEAGLTQVSVAGQIGTDQGCVSRYEHGKVPGLAAQLDTIDRYCAAIGCDPFEIVAPYFRRSAVEPEQVAS